MRKFLAGFFFMYLLVAQPGYHTEAVSGVMEGVYNNFNYSNSASFWLGASKWFSNQNGLLDIVVGQANEDGYVHMAFPVESDEAIISFSDVDQVEPYLKIYQEANMKVILSIQPMRSTVTTLIDLILSRYAKYSSLLGVNVDLEWKLSGEAHHVSDAERDEWLGVLASYGSSLKLFLTYYGDVSNFPSDYPGIVILFDGANSTQQKILERYGELSKNFQSVGLYTGYTSSIPPSTDTERILSAAPNTQYIIHTDDVFSNKRAIIIELDNIQPGWRETAVNTLLDLHLTEQAPLLCSVIPGNLTNPEAGTGTMPKHLKNLVTNYPDVFEIAQQGYLDLPVYELRGMSYEDQREIISRGLSVFTEMGILPVTFIPMFDSADNTTIKVLEELGFGIMISGSNNLSSDKLLILDTYIELSLEADNTTVIKTPQQIMDELSKIEFSKPVILKYEVNAFRPGIKNYYEAVKDIITAIKGNPDLMIMTPKQYQQNIVNKFKPAEQETDAKKADYLSIVALSIATLSILSILYYFSTKRRYTLSQNNPVK